MIFAAKISRLDMTVKTQKTGFYGLREDFSLFYCFSFLGICFCVFIFCKTFLIMSNSFTTFQKNTCL